MIKRYLSTLILVVSFLLILPIAAHADVLLEPHNDFYTRHSSECVYLSRSFYANGESGSVSLKKEPGSNEEVLTIKNGEVIHIMFTYDYKGELWGVTEIYSSDKPYDQWPTGWIPMDQLLLKYDYISFAEEHQSEFHAYTGDYETLKTSEPIVFWSWPGSGVEVASIEMSEETFEYFSFSHAYTDDQGREWGFVGYLYASRNMWVCINDPTNHDIPAFNPPPKWDDSQPPYTISQDNVGEATIAQDVNAQKNGISISMLVIVLVAVLVSGTAVLIRVFWRQDSR